MLFEMLIHYESFLYYSSQFIVFNSCSSLATVQVITVSYFLSYQLMFVDTFAVSRTVV